MPCDDYMTCCNWINLGIFGLGWGIGQKLKIQIELLELNPRKLSVLWTVQLDLQSQNLMKLFLDETRHPGLSNHINYKTIEPEMREICIFEVTLESCLLFWPV